MIVDCLFGINHISVVSNNPEYGNLGHGVVIEATSSDEEYCLPISLNESEGGASIVLCSGWESGSNEANFVSAFYLLRIGCKNGKVQAKCVKGSDKWQFGTNQDGVVTVKSSSVSRSAFALYHNKEDLSESVPVKGSARADYAIAVDGAERTRVMKQVGRADGTLLVLCSHSSGVLDATAAALYSLTLQNGSVSSECVAANCGAGYEGGKADVWSFKVIDEDLVAVGPSGPCKYASMSNLLGNSVGQATSMCIATGDATPFQGRVSIDSDGISGVVSKRVSLVVKRNEEAVMLFKDAELVKVNGSYAFSRKWAPDEKSSGLHMIRVFAICKKFIGKCWWSLMMVWYNAVDCTDIILHSRRR